MASPSSPSQSPGAGWLRWQPLSPLVAAATLWFLGRVWHHHFPWPVWMAVVLSAWAGALVAHASGGGPAASVRRPWLVAAALGLTAALIAVRWLPRGLVVAAIPVVGLGIFQALMGLGHRSPWAHRLAVGGATVGTIGVLAVAPFNWPIIVRFGLIVLAAIFLSLVWKGGEKSAIAESPLVLFRGLVFAGGLLVPVAWWMPGGLLPEIARPENGVFAVLAIVAATCRAEVRRAAPSVPRLTGCAAFALGLCAVSAFGARIAPAGPVRAVFLGVAAVALLLSVGLAVGLRGSVPALCPRLVPDLAWIGLVVVGLGDWGL